MKAVNPALRDAQTTESLGLLQDANVSQMRCVGISAFSVRDCDDSHRNACPAKFGN
jgi:hypothetical protein